MSFEGRAFYNLLRMDGAEEYLKDIKDWQILNYRALKLSELFQLLEKEGVHLNPDSFQLYAEKCVSPEEIVDTLLADQEDIEKLDRAYLVIFELWRRLCKDKQSLSVFCDELDYQIEKYDNEEGDEEVMQEMLTELESILDQSVDGGEDPKVIFQVISDFVAHDLEDFIYDFASAQLSC